jgi:hypothetical protein
MLSGPNKPHIFRDQFYNYVHTFMKTKTGGSVPIVTVNMILSELHPYPILKTKDLDSVPAITLRSGCKCTLPLQKIIPNNNHIVITSMSAERN